MIKEPIQDPSVNVLNLVGNATKYLEELHRQSECYFTQRLELAIEASQRERAAETERVDANRKNDNEAVKIAHEFAIKQAETLAKQMADNAETLRASIAKTAEILATQLQQTTKSLDDRLRIVENRQNEGQGTGKGAREMWGWVSAGVLLFIAIVEFWIR